MAVNSTRQQEILAAAKQTGTRAELFWYPVDVNGREDRGVLLAGMLPLIPVGNEDWSPRLPMTSQSEMQVLLELIRCAAPKLALRAELTTLALVEEMGIPWFVYGAHDHVCPGCGAIGGDCVCVPVREVAHA